VPFPPLKESFEILEEALQIALQMWSDDNGPFTGKHYQLAETLCSPQPVARPRPRIMIGCGGEKKTLRLVAQYADACNFFGSPEDCAHKIGVLRGHCDTLGRDISEIEGAALLRLPPGFSADDIVREGEAYAKMGVATLIGVPVGPDPVAELERLPVTQ